MYTIGQFAKKTGLTIRALRYYDEKGLLIPASLTEGGQRLYNDENIYTVQKIVTYKYLDFTIEEIRTLLKEELPIIDSLYEQKALLEEKKKQLEKIIGSLETAISIHERTKVVDPTIFLLVLNSLLTEEQQKNYLQQYLPKSLVDRMYSSLENDLVELNRKYIEVAYEIKEAYKMQLSDDALQMLLQKFLNIIPQDVQKQITEAFMEVQIEQLDEWLFPSPFTKEEEEWVTSAMVRLKMMGDDVHDESSS